MEQIIRVGIADLKLCKTPDKITTVGLGSCIGIVLYSATHDVCGMVHIMLPSSKEIKNNSNRAKFADTGIVELVSQMEKLGANKARLEAKIAGGATMFQFNTNNGTMMIGERNVEASKQKLAELNIPLLAQDTGANYGRTVTYYPETGEFHIRAVGKAQTVI